MGAMPSRGIRIFVVLRIIGALAVRPQWNNVQFPFTEPERGFDCFGQAGSIFVTDGDSVLNHLYPGAQRFYLRRIVHPHHLMIDPDPEVALLLQEIEER